MDLSICIVNWNRGDLLAQCLCSIYETAPRVGFEVLVVDNASSDGSAALVEREYSQVTLIKNNENVGFARANNQALRISRGRYCLLLNSDTIVLPAALDTMVEVMDARPSVGVLTCLMYTTRALETVSISFSDTFPTPTILVLNDLVGLTGLRKLFPQSRLIQRCVWTGRHPEQEQEVGHVSGACMMVRREAMQAVGLLDEAYFFSMEETDWCYRIKQQGWQVYYTPRAQIVHLGQGSRSLRADQRALYYKSICTFLRKHYGWRSVVVYRVWYFCVINPLQRLYGWYRQAINTPTAGKAA